MVLRRGAAEDNIHTAVPHDIMRRQHIKRQNHFDRVVKYVIENMVKAFSANSIARCETVRSTVKPAF